MRPINLLPPEAFDRLTARRLRSRIAVIAVLYLLLLALITVFQSDEVGDTEEAVTAQEALNTQLEREVVSLSDAQTLVDDFDTNALLVTEALAFDMSWGRIINDLARMIPDRVWLQSFAGTIDETGLGPLGSVTISGVGFDYPDISAWLRSLDSDRFPGVTGTWVQTVSETEIGEADVVSFSSTTSLTDHALSGRASNRVPELDR